MDWWIAIPLWLAAASSVLTTVLVLIGLRAGLGGRVRVNLSDVALDKAGRASWARGRPYSRQEEMLLDLIDEVENRFSVHLSAFARESLILMLLDSPSTPKVRETMFMLFNRFGEEKEGYPDSTVRSPDMLHVIHSLWCRIPPLCGPGRD
jgi:hypothetical protein